MIAILSRQFRVDKIQYRLKKKKKKKQLDGKTVDANSNDVIRISKNFFSPFNARSSGACVTKFYSLFTE